MRNVLDRLELLAAWLKPGGEHPTEPIPDKYSTLVEAIAEIERLQAAKRRALQLADDRAIEANDLRARLSTPDDGKDTRKEAHE
jgi:hypothetical protein